MLRETLMHTNTAVRHVCIPTLAVFEWGRRERSRALYRGTSIMRTPPPLGPYCRPMPRALWWLQGGGLFLMSEVPLYAPPPRLCLSGGAERGLVLSALFRLLYHSQASS